MSTHITIGTDPELVLMDNRGALVRAGSVIADANAEFGVDGHPFTAELRPEPAVHPKELVDNLRRTFNTQIDRLKGYSWLCGPWALDKPLGGHIHFGIPFEDKYREALDAQFGIVMGLVEPEEEARKRRTITFPGARDQRPYGLLGDVRKKEWGFEYRTPSSFIVSPGVTQGMLAISKAIVFEELEKGPAAHSRLSSKVREELRFDPEDFHNLQRYKFLEKMDPFWKILRGMKYFSKGMEGEDCWPSVSYLKAQVINKGGFKTSKDIKERWRLLPEGDLKKQVDAIRAKYPAEDKWWQWHELPVMGEVVEQEALPWPIHPMAYPAADIWRIMDGGRRR